MIFLKKLFEWFILNVLILQVFVFTSEKKLRFAGIYLRNWEVFENFVGINFRELH